jgi:class 3 adenylate cyclase/tetratricopeptide (TPR) repeat protein
MNERTQLEHAIAALESQRALLGDAVVEAALGSMREKLAALHLATGSPPTEQQRKHATILFADISGFTAMSETMDAEDVSDTMNTLWQQLDTVITSHDGMVDKHIGDAVMALWGAQIGRENDPERAIRAALDLQTALAAFRTAQAVPLHLRIGINTGPVLLGMVGTTNEFTAMGDTVNVASRLEHAAPVGGILISHHTYRHVRGLFDVQVLDPITVKGKVEPIQVYLILRAKPRALSLGKRGVEGVQTRMIGREADFLRLQHAVRAMIKDGDVHAITVLGDAGLGKSRLFYELRSWIERLPETINLFIGRATQEMTRLPYALLRDVFAFRFAIQESDPALVAREKLVAGVVDFLGDHHPEALLKAQLIGHLLGFDFSASSHLAGILDDPRQLRHRALLALIELFAALTQREPLVVVLEDIHWADDASLDTLAYLAEQCAAMPLLLLYLSRPILLERRPAWGEDHAAHSRLILQPLSQGDSRRLVEDILRHLPTIPDAVRELIVGGADGNPFYVEELIKMLIEQGVIVPGAAEWRIADDRLVQAQVPPTLIGVLQARLDGLPAEERTTLQQASVIGRVFWDQAVDRLRKPDDVYAQNLLEDLRGRELVYRHETSAFAAATEYLFKHALLREVTYETLLKRQRRSYHAQAAAWLIAASGDRVDKYAGLIAEHYELAGVAAEAAQWYLQAGEQAQAAYANDSALLAYEKARSFLPEGSRAGVLLHLGSVYETVGRWEEAEGCYQTALAEAAIDPLTQARIQRDYGILLRLRGAYPAALPWLEQAQATFQNLGVRLEESRTLTEIGVVYWRQAEYAAANRILEASLTVARDLDDRPHLAVILHYLGTVAMHQSRHGLAQTYYQDSLDVARTLGDKQKLARTLGNMGVLASDQGEYALAQQHHTDALALAQEVGNKGLVAHFLGNLGEDAYEQDHLAEAEAYATQSLALRRELGEKLGMAVSLGNLGMIAYRRGDYATARMMLEESLDSSRELGSKQFMCYGLAGLGLLALTHDDLRLAQTYYREALHIAQEMDNMRLIASGLVGMAAVVSVGAAPTKRTERTVHLLAAAMALLTASTNALERNDRELYDQTLARARASLAADRFAAAWATGEALSLEEAIALALTDALLN